MNWTCSPYIAKQHSSSSTLTLNPWTEKQSTTIKSHLHTHNTHSHSLKFTDCRSILHGFNLYHRVHHRPMPAAAAPPLQKPTPFGGLFLLRRQISQTLPTFFDNSLHFGPDHLCRTLVHCPAPYTASAAGIALPQPGGVREIMAGNSGRQCFHRWGFAFPFWHALIVCSWRLI